MNAFSYRNLSVWQKSIDLAEIIYKLTEKFPRGEEYNLKSQLRSAALSISSNIAEGSGRIGTGDQGRFYVIARASLLEIDSQLEFSRRLGLLSESIDPAFEILMHEVYRMLSGLMAGYKNK